MKAEADRLADALDSITFVSGKSETIGEAAALLRQWPDGEPVAWVDDLTRAAPHCVTDLKYCSVAQHDRGEHLKYVPLYTAPPDQSARIAAQPDGEPVAWQAQVFNVRHLTGEVRLRGIDGAEVPQDFVESGTIVEVRAVGTAPPDTAARIAELEKENEQREAKTVRLLRAMEDAFHAGTAGHEQVFAQSQEKSKRIAELEAENAALKADAERLNAVDSGLWFCEPQMDELKPSWRVGKVNNNGLPEHQGKTLREAIDAARSKT